jgi:dihydroorotase
MAAVAGGFTAISAMANTNPVADTAGVVEQVFRLGKAAGLVDVNPIGAVTKGLHGEQLAELGAMADSIAKVRIFSDDGKCVSDPLIMRRALEYVKTFNGIIAQHAQEPRLTVNAQMNEGSVSARIGLPGWPAIAEEAIIARDILLAEHVQSRLHICHLTTAGGVELVRWAKKRGIQITAEVTPNHLLLTDDLVENYDPIYKVNPPLRTEKDVMALREGLAEGVIDIVATDHAPHPAEDKDCEWQAAAFGMVGLETALSVVVKTMIETKMMSWNDLMDRMSIAPAKIAGYPTQGQLIAEKNYANLTIIDTDKSWIVDREKLQSQSKNTPFNGYELPAVVTDVFHNGVQVLKDGQVIGSGNLTND